MKRILKILLPLMLIVSAVTLTSCGENFSWRTGIFSTVSFSLYSESGTVTVRARNDFTLGLATVKLTISIYSSDVETDSISSMILEKTKVISNLSIFTSEEISVHAPSSGKYYVGVMKSRNNDGGTDTYKTAQVFVKG